MPCRVANCISALLLAQRLPRYHTFADLRGHQYWRVRFAPQASRPAQLAALAATVALSPISLTVFLAASQIYVVYKLGLLECTLWILISLARMVHRMATGRRFKWPRFGFIAWRFVQAAANAWGMVSDEENSHYGA